MSVKKKSKRILSKHLVAPVNKAIASFPFCSVKYLIIYRTKIRGKLGLCTHKWLQEFLQGYSVPFYSNIYIVHKVNSHDP